METLGKVQDLPIRIIPYHAVVSMPRHVAEV